MSEQSEEPIRLDPLDVNPALLEREISRLETSIKRLIESNQELLQGNVALLFCLFVKTGSLTCS
jgi:hypothetical protein